MVKRKNIPKRQENSRGFMFDTNIFDDLLNNKIDLNLLPKKLKYYITHIQEDEINSMNDDKKEKKNQLLLILSRFNGEMIPTEANILGVSQYGACKFGNGVKIPLESFVPNVSGLGSEAKLDGTTYSEALQSGNLRHVEDALIGETALVNNLTLVSNDESFRNKVHKLGGKALSFSEFLNTNQS